MREIKTKHRLSKVLNDYQNRLPEDYLNEYSKAAISHDVEKIDLLSTDNPIEIELYRAYELNGSPLRLKLFQYGNRIPLSDILPVLEHFDLRTLSDRTFKIDLETNNTVYVSDFTIEYKQAHAIDLAKVKSIFHDALRCVLAGECENDGFNKLILSAQLSYREITILRAYAKYLHQIRFRFSQHYIEKTLAAHFSIAKKIVELFILKNNPKKKLNAKKIKTIEDDLRALLDKVPSLDDDRILRRFWSLVEATLRTNFFQTQDGRYKNYLSFKFKSSAIPEMPLPHPLYEIFVYSTRFEGIHLRSAKVARGGLRWSDRREDFRTEILGLMKAQVVKNAVIVPSGAKGGFVLKMVPESREAASKEVINCYKTFIKGLLDLTDNLVGKKVIRPANVVCHDEEDTYLVVAADKGTASFSDIANSISKEYNYWLGDAFASGGSTGYDHKKMGITARGAWESIKRHFHELNVDIYAADFSVVGIGDMSGDVFGNGMIYTNHIRLIAAFDHRDIFLDPNPDAKKSFVERERLFHLSASSWQDYDKKLISKGGGVYSRTNKSIPISSEVKKVLNITDDSLAPNELIQAILKAEVDLLYNGGIGTYVKASTESHSEVGDKSNEFCRINANELRCRVVGEGGNLGFTQFGRIEYALQGGLINTDFIDNSAGVDCSDHEVNIKILLDREIAKGNLTEIKRNKLLASMTQSVAELVLQDNYHQALTMSFSMAHAVELISLHQNYIHDLESLAVINRVIEFLPDDRRILERKASGQSLTRPELAVLLAYTKIHVKNEILKSDIPEDPFLKTTIEAVFPKELVKLYPKAMQDHPLRREIIATQLSNYIINEMGITFVYRLQMETGATVGEIVRAYIVAANVFNATELLFLIDSLGFKISLGMQYELFYYIRRLLNLSTRWFLHTEKLKNNMEKIIKHYAERVKILEGIIPNLMLGMTKAYLDTLTDGFVKSGISKDVAHRIAITRAIYSTLNIIEMSTKHHFDLIKTAKIYFDVGGRFHLVWFRDQIANDTREGHWNTLARLTLRDELDILQKQLTVAIIKSAPKEVDANKLFPCWAGKNQRLLQRWDKVLEMLHGSSSVDYSMFFIAIRELANLIK